MTLLTNKQAYLAMYAFLEAEYELSKSADIGGLLGSLSLLHNGQPADPAVSAQWEKAVKKAFSNKVDVHLDLTRAKRL